ncbi:MAG: hypothetical protein IKX40_00925 [Thermoguttaceae bacterium]|nr:hypothetical protein [Thermoguttaceae bacterium]
MEEEFDKPTDSDERAPETDAADQELSSDSREEDALEEKAFIEFKNNLLEEYKVRSFYMDLINETSRRRVNLAMLLAQLFGRYNKIETISFLGIAIAVITIQSVGVYFGAPSDFVYVLTLLMTGLTFLFAHKAVNRFLSALSDLRLIKRGYCSLGYQHVRPEVAETTPEDCCPSSIMVAYKDISGMIHTKDIPTKQQRLFFMPPVVMVFADNADSDKIVVLEAVPHEIQYDKSRKMFTQEWRCAIYALVPLTMIILYAISLYLGALGNL